MGIGPYASHVTSGEHAAEPESFVVRLQSGERLHYLDWGAPGALRDPSREPGDPSIAPGDPSIVPGDPPPLPLVLVHGIAQTAWSWAPVARRMCAVTRVLALDLRGHGLSDAPRSGYDLETLALDVLTVMSGNGWGVDVGGPPAVLAGHGFGAQICVTAAASRPGSVAGVALLDGGWEEVGEQTRSTPAEFLATIAEPPEVLASMDAFLADRRDFDPGTWDSDQERAARAQVDQKHAGHVGSVVRAGVLRQVVDAMFAYQPLEALAKVAAPVVILVAEAATADDEDERERRLALVDVTRARGEAALPPPRVVRFPGAGHNLMRYRAAEVADELTALLGSAATSARTPDDPA